MYFLISRYFILPRRHLGLAQARQSPTLMLFLKMYPGSEKPFFLSIGSLKITSCSKRKTRLSFARERKLLSCSVTVKVSCWSSLPWAVIFPCTTATTNAKHRASGYFVAFTGLIVIMKKCSEDCEGWSEFLRSTSKPWSLPTFIMSLQRFGTKHITSTAFCLKDNSEVGQAC